MSKLLVFYLITGKRYVFPFPIHKGKLDSARAAGSRVIVGPVVNQLEYPLGCDTYLFSIVIRYCQRNEACAFVLARSLVRVDECCRHQTAEGLFAPPSRWDELSTGCMCEILNDTESLRLTGTVRDFGLRVPRQTAL